MELLKNIIKMATTIVIGLVAFMVGVFVATAIAHTVTYIY